MTGSLRDMSADEIVEEVRALQPTWNFSAGFPDMTFALATGVGKTRLMGAIMAYLFRAVASRNFLILAPRDAILRKLEVESRETSPKYIFCSRGIVPQPRVCDRDNLLEFDPHAGVNPMGVSSPNVFILSPQLLLTGERIGARSDFVGASLKEYLQTCGDLIVLVDESHHLSSVEIDRAARTWANAVASLHPKMVFSMTATPRAGANVAYEYGLKQCLLDGVYTKEVRLIVDEKGASIPPADYDARTLGYALDRLTAKDDAIRAYRKSHQFFPDIRPVLLVCAQDHDHADLVGEWLVEKKGLKRDEVLIIHSDRKTEADLARLAALEEPTSKVKVIVQVHVLEEGWDVTNVYVISPLRNVQSYVNARQVMGRGLRLPAGYRVKDQEIDTLDVLAFGQETFESVYAQAKADLVDGEAGQSGISVVEAKGRMASAGADGSIVSQDGLPSVGMKFHHIPLLVPKKIDLPAMELVWPDIAVRIDPTALQSHVAAAKALILGDMTTDRVRGRLMLSPEAVIQTVTDYVVRECPYLSAAIHGKSLIGAVEAHLAAIARYGAEGAGVDPVLLGMAVKEIVDMQYNALVPSYQDSGLRNDFMLAAVRVHVPASLKNEPTKDGLTWTAKQHRGIPISGWKKCLHRAAAFDSLPEFEMACHLDQMAGVDGWMRNHPHQIRIPTVAGETRPDFLIWFGSSAGSGLIYLEIKGKYLWKPGSEARLNARDARLYAEAITASSGAACLEYRVILEDAVTQVVALEDLRTRDALVQTPAG